MPPPGAVRVEARELRHRVEDRPLLGAAGAAIEAPAVRVRAHRVDVHHLLQPGPRPVGRIGPRHRIALEVAVEHDLVAVLVGVDPVQHVGRRRLEPLHVGAGPAPRHHAEARRLIGVEPRAIHALREQRRIPVQRQIVPDDEVLGERDVVRQARPGQRHVGGVDQRAGAIDHAVAQVGRGGGVAPHQQLAGVRVELGVRRDAAGERGGPWRGAARRQRRRIVRVHVAALIERGERRAGVDHDVGRRRVLHATARAPAVAQRACRRLDDAGPLRRTGGVLGGEPGGAHHAVAIARAPVLELDRVNHAVAVERVVATDRRVQRVLGVAQVHAIELARDRALEHVEVIGVVLDQVGSPRAGAVRMIVVGRQPRRPGVDRADLHAAPPSTNAQAVVPLPPRLSVANRRAPSIW